MIRLAFAAGLAVSLAAAPAAAQLRAEKRADLSVPVLLGPGQGAIVVGFRRPDTMSAGKSGAIAFSRYDPAKRDLILQPRGAKKAGDTTTYWVLARSGDRLLPLDHAVLIVSAGDYVAFGAGPGPGGLIANTFCLGAPTFRVDAGEVVYFGDLTPYILAKMADGGRDSAMAWSFHPDDARTALARQPALAAAFRPAELHNNATYGCVAQAMLAYTLPGVPDLPPAPPAHRRCAARSGRRAVRPGEPAGPPSRCRGGTPSATEALAMLEHVPHWLGHAMRGLRAGADKLVIADPALGAGFATLDLMSPAFANGARLPVRFTADGAGVSPPLVWGEAPAGTTALALIVEDPDAPARHPLVHAIVWGLPPDARRLAEGAVAADGTGAADGRDVGRNSFLREGWLPPDPPTGHGPHHYAFQLFALADPPDPGATPSRGAIVPAMAGRVLAAGLLVGTYDRGDPAPIGRGQAAPAM